MPNVCSTDPNINKHMIWYGRRYIISAVTKYRYSHGNPRRQCRRKYRPILVLRRKKKNAVVKDFTSVVFIFTFYSI